MIIIMIVRIICSPESTHWTSTLTGFLLVLKCAFFFFFTTVDFCKLLKKKDYGNYFGAATVSLQTSSLEFLRNMFLPLCFYSLTKNEIIIAFINRNSSIAITGTHQKYHSLWMDRALTQQRVPQQSSYERHLWQTNKNIKQIQLASQYTALFNYAMHIFPLFFRGF